VGPTATLASRFRWIRPPVGRSDGAGRRLLEAARSCPPEVNGPEVGCVFVEREVRARLVVVREVRGQGAAQVPFAEDENVIQTLASDRTDEALGKRILPGAVRRREDFGDPHALQAALKLMAVDLIAVAHEKGRRGVIREGVDDLLGGPGAVGCSVTLKWTTRRRWWASTTRTKRTRSRAVGTVKKSIETKSRT
jgi:hypothetical protein